MPGKARVLKSAGIFLFNPIASGLNALYVAILGTASSASSQVLPVEDLTEPPSGCHARMDLLDRADLKPSVASTGRRALYLVKAKEVSFGETKRRRPSLLPPTFCSGAIVKRLKIIIEIYEEDDAQASTTPEPETINANAEYLQDEMEDILADYD